MEDRHNFEAIDKATFEHVLRHYTSSLSPEVSEELDALRYKTIPDAVKARGDDAYIDKEELVHLVTWKLKHGTFRPTLKALVQQNDAKAVEQASRKGFASFRFGDLKAAITNLTKLRGIGPATASLMLSVLRPDKAPFFSDEFFRWAFFEPGKGRGWDRPIKYNVKEYQMLYEKARELERRLGVSVVDAEKVAFVLGKGALPSISKDKVAKRDPRHDAKEPKPAVAKGKQQKRASTEVKSDLQDTVADPEKSDDTSLRRSKRQKTK